MLESGRSFLPVYWPTKIKMFVVKYRVVLKRKGWENRSAVTLMLFVCMSTAVPMCPNCQSEAVIKNGLSRHQKQNYKGRDCGRQFVEDPQWRMISQETKGIIDRLLSREVVAGRNCPCLRDIRTVGATIRQCEIPTGRAGGASAPKAKTPSDGADGSIVVICRQQRQQAVGVACPRCPNPWDRRGAHRQPQRRLSTSSVAVDAPGLPPMCCSLQRFLVSLCGGLTRQTAGMQWAKKQEKPATLNASIAPCVRACRVWFVKACRSQRSSTITLEQFGYSSTITMLRFLSAHPFLLRTTLARSRC